MADDVSLPAKVRLINLLNEENAQQGAVPISADHVSFGDPEPTALNNRNTVAVLTARPGSGFKGKKTVYFNRLDLNNYFAAVVNEVTLHVNSPQNTYDLLPAVMEEYGVHLDEEDIVSAAVSGPTAVITAKPTSYGWIGNVLVNVVTFDIPLNTLYSTTQLAGFIYNGSPSYAIADILVNSAQQLLDLINTSNGQSLTFNEVSFDPPQATVPDVAGRNTQVTMRAVSQGGYSGQINFLYKRVDPEILYPSGFTLTGSIASVTNTQGVIQHLSDELGVALVNGEVVNDAVSNTAINTIVAISNNSYVWAPGTAFVVDLPTVNLAGLLDAIMDGFVYNNESPSWAEADPTLPSLGQLRDLINAQNGLTLTTNDYTLSDLDTLIGSGDPSGKNSIIIANAQLNSEYTGTQTLKYNRVDIGQWYTNGLNLPNRGYIRTSQALYAAIATIYGLALRSDEIVSEAIADSATSYSLTISDTSEVWLAGSTINITFAAIPPIPSDAFLLDSGSPFMFDSGSIMTFDGG